LSNTYAVNVQSFNGWKSGMWFKKKFARLLYALRRSRPALLQGKSIELRIPSDPVFLRLVRATIEPMCTLAGFNRRDASKIILAVDEACANVIRHAYNNRQGQPIYITCEIHSPKLVITIVDLGDPADVKAIKPRRLDDIRPGGLGVYIIRSVMDEVQYENLAEIGNRLVMAKYLPKGMTT
jgi:anti-sigma regulatory factor (Ser/Thr protein kinase)